MLEARTLWHFEPDSSRPIAKQTADGKLGYIVTDHLGTPREMLDENGEAAWRATHHLWGNVRQSWAQKRTFVAGNTALKEEETDFCPFRFQGQWADEESGLFYNRYRHYDPLAGSYISSDPIGLKGGDRPNGYVTNSQKLIDPQGLNNLWGTGPLRPPARPLLENEGVLIDASKGLQSAKPGDGAFKNVVPGQRPDVATKYLYVVDERGVVIVREMTPMNTPRGNVVHTNLAKQASIGGEAWFGPNNSVTINAGSGRFGDAAGITPQQWNATADLWRSLGYDVNQIPFGQR